MILHSRCGSCIELGVSGRLLSVTRLFAVPNCALYGVCIVHTYHVTQTSAILAFPKIMRGPLLQGPWPNHVLCFLEYLD